MRQIVFPSQLPLIRLTTSKPARFSGALICCCLLLWMLSSSPASAETKPNDAALTLQTLEEFHSAEQTRARKPVVDAETSYRSKLEKFQKAAQADGNLKSVIAAKEAIAELDAGRSPLISNDVDVAVIQQDYMAQRQKADTESKRRLDKVDRDHLVKLKMLVAELTKAGNIDQALEVQAKVDGLAASISDTPGAEEIESWKKKAVEEFPELKLPESEMARSFKTLKQEKEASSPSFFKNPKWPYLLAEEAKKLSDRKPDDKLFIYLDDLKETEAKLGYGILGKHGANYDVRGSVVLVNGIKPEHSLCPHPPDSGSSFVFYDLNAKFSEFSGTATVADKAHQRSLRFRIKGDGKTLWRSGVIETGKDAQEFRVSVDRVNRLELEIECPGSAYGAWGIWVSPRLTMR